MARKKKQTNLDKLFAKAAAGFRALAAEHEANGPEAKQVVVTAVRVGRNAKGWDWTGDAVTADRIYGGSDYTGGELGPDVALADVGRKIAEQIQADGLVICGTATLDVEGHPLLRWNGKGWS